MLKEANELAQGSDLARVLGISTARPSLRAVELFGGAGGLGIGATCAGIVHEALIDVNELACQTLRRNIFHFPGLSSDRILREDVRHLDFRQFEGKATMLLAGAPCQPWSLAGKHHGPDDARNLFDEVIRALREVKPDALVIENVRGLGRPAFAGFREYLLLALSFPELVRECANWVSALPRLRRLAQQRSRDALKYRVYGPVLLNAADYGTAQSRQRVFVVAIRASISKEWAPPLKTHSRSLLLSQIGVGGLYWLRHGLRGPTRRSRAGMRSIHAAPDRLLGGAPWRTVRDCIADLPPPNTRDEPVQGHKLVRGARSYPGHSGSTWDWPAKTLKAGVHGVPGGENTVRSPHNGKVRYFTVREAARLQDFPDDYVFAEGWTAAYRQIGNAVPARLAEAVIRSVANVVEF